VRHTEAIYQSCWRTRLFYGSLITDVSPASLVPSGDRNFPFPSSVFKDDLVLYTIPPLQGWARLSETQRALGLATAAHDSMTRALLFEPNNRVWRVALALTQPPTPQVGRGWILSSSPSPP
jgi:hypothetical protein